MLTEMDGAQGLDGVYVLAATSRPDLIDPALLRPGRLDKSILCDMPSYSDRLEILQSFTNKLECSPSIDFEQLAHDTEGFSGADLQALVYNAHLDVVHSVLNKPEDEPKSKGKASEGKGKGKAVEEPSSSKGKGKEVAANGSAEPDAPKRPYRQLQPEETPITSAQRAAFTERVSPLPILQADVRLRLSYRRQMWSKPTRTTLSRSTKSRPQPSRSDTSASP